MKRCEKCNIIASDEHSFCPVDGFSLANDDVATRLQASLGMKYSLTELIGKGAMGAVYRARHRDLDDVAIKVMLGPPDNQQLSERFIREARALRKLRHQHAVTIYDVDRSTPGLTYMVMEMVAGGNLREDLRERGRLTLDEVMEIATAVCGALHAAHERGIIHRDIKPDNILMAKETTITGKVLRTIKIADFGIVKLRGNQRGGEASIKLTQFGTPIGTPFYMSPEQWFGEGAGITALDGRTDIYALGCTLYELLSGRTPFVGNTTSELRRQHLEREPTPLHEVAKNVPELVSRVIMRTLAKDRDERYQTAADFLADLKRAYDESFGKTASTTRTQLLSKQMRETIDPAKPASSTGSSGRPDRQSTMEVLPYAQPPQIYNEQAETEDDEQEPMPIRLAKAVEEARRRIEEEQRRNEEEARRKAEEEAARLHAEEEERRLEEERRRAEEEARRRAQEEVARRRAEEEARRRAEAEARRLREEEDARRRAEEEQRRAEEEARRKAEEEARRRAEEEALRRAAEEAKRREEEERLRAEAEAQRLAEEEAARKRAEEEARRRAEEEAKRKEEAERLRAEQEARKKAEEEARRRAEEQARRRAEEEALRRAQEEAQRREQEAALRRAEEEEARKRREEEEQRRAEEEARRKAEEEARKAEAARRKALEEERRRAAEEQQRRERERQEKEERERALAAQRERQRLELEKERASQAAAGGQQPAEEEDQPADTTTMLEKHLKNLAAQLDSPQQLADTGPGPTDEQAPARPNAEAAEALRETAEKATPPDPAVTLPPPPPAGGEAHRRSIMGYTPAASDLAAEPPQEEAPFDPETTLVPGINIKPERTPPQAQETPVLEPKGSPQPYPLKSDEGYAPYTPQQSYGGPPLERRPSQDYSPMPDYKPAPPYASFPGDARAIQPRGRRQVWLIAALVLLFLAVAGGATILGVYLYRRLKPTVTTNTTTPPADDDGSNLLATAAKGTITITAPQGSEVFIDDERAGEVGSDGQFTKEVPAGLRQVRITKSGSRPWSQDVKVGIETNEKVPVRLQKELAPIGDAPHEHRRQIDRYKRVKNNYGIEVEFRELLKTDPNDVAAHIGLADALYAQDRYAEALTEYEAALRLQSNNPQAHSSLGQIYEIKRRDADAETAYAHAVELRPRSAFYKTLLAWVLLRRNKLDEASAMVEQAIQIDASNREALDTKAHILLARGQTEEALKLAQSNAERDSNDSLSRATVAVILHRMGRTEEAKEAYRQLRSSKPDEDWGDLKRLMMFQGYSRPVLETLSKLISETN